MRALAMAWAAVALVLLAGFIAAEAAGLPGTDAGALDRKASVTVACLVVMLLTVDAVLPVPSSVVMVASGALFGVALGSALSLAGGIGSLLVCSWVGSRGVRSQLRLASDERPGVEELVGRYGAAAVAASRPVPLLAESVAVMAAAAGMTTCRVVVAGTAGLVPITIVYALAGALGREAGILVVASTAGAAAVLVVLVPWWRRALAQEGAK